MQHHIRFGQYEGGVDQIGKGNNSTESFVKSLEEQKHRNRNTEDDLRKDMLQENTCTKNRMDTES